MSENFNMENKAAFVEMAREYCDRIGKDFDAMAPAMKIAEVSQMEDVSRLLLVDRRVMADLTPLEQDRGETVIEVSARILAGAIGEASSSDDEPAEGDDTPKKKRSKK